MTGGGRGEERSGLGEDDAVAGFRRTADQRARAVRERKCKRGI